MCFDYDCISIILDPLYFRRDLTQLSDVTASLEADGSSPQIMLESFGRRRAAPMFRTGGAALVGNHHQGVAKVTSYTYFVVQLILWSQPV